MSETKVAHTPGPWRLEVWGDHSARILSDTSQICRLVLGPSDGTEEVAKLNDRASADAELIAAAPDLLAACRAAEPVAHISAAGLPVPDAVSSNRLIAHRDGCPGCTLRQSIARAEGGAS